MKTQKFLSDDSDEEVSDDDISDKEVFDKEQIKTKYFDY